MKKKNSLIMAILFLIILTFILPIDSTIGRIKEFNDLNSSKPSEQEITQFKQLVNSNTYFYYNNLDASLKDAYLIMYSSFMSFDDSFSISVTADDVSKIFTAVLYDNPHIFWVSNNYKYIENENSVTFNPQYRLRKQEADEISQKLNQKIDEILSATENLNSVYDIELYIHDYVCENTVYDENTINVDGDTAYGSLLNGSAICEGYSRAIQILLDAVDIDNYLVVGDGTSDGKTEPHMWNIVNINGMNYHLDATWNDSGADNSILYFYFNVTDEYIMRDHSNITPLNNGCVSETYNYFIVENTYVERYNGFENHIEHSAELLRDGNNSVDFLFKGTDDFKRAVSDIKKDNGFFKYIYNAVKKSGRKLNPYEIEYYTIDDQNYLCIVFKEE